MDFSLLLFQIVILNYGLLNDKDRPIALILIFIYCIYIFNYNYKNDKFKMEKGENGHLIWHYVDIPFPILLIVLLFYIYPAFQYGNMLFIGITIPLLISLYFYYKYKTWGTMWCYFSNLYWLILLGFSIMKK